MASTVASRTPWASNRTIAASIILDRVSFFILRLAALFRDEYLHRCQFGAFVAQFTNAKISQIDELYSYLWVEWMRAILCDIDPDKGDAPLTAWLKRKFGTSPTPQLCHRCSCHHALLRCRTECSVTCLFHKNISARHANQPPHAQHQPVGDQPITNRTRASKHHSQLETMSSQRSLPQHPQVHR